MISLSNPIRMDLEESAVSIYARRKSLKDQIRMYGFSFLVIIWSLLGVVMTFTRDTSMKHDTSPNESEYNRFLQATNITTEGSEEDEVNTCGNLQDWEKEWGVFLYIAALLYIFLALAIICDDYFVLSLEKISEALGLSSDVAGATFMAAGSSAPELFVSLADNVFAKPKESLGVGTIVGSAIFNVLIIIGLSALLSGQVLNLDWRPLLRDCLWYLWAICVLAYAMHDEIIDIYESLLLVLSYLGYILYMSQNERVINTCCKRMEDIEMDTVKIEKQMSEQSRTVTITTTTTTTTTSDGEVVETLERTSSTQSLSGQHHGPHRANNPLLQPKFRYSFRRSGSMSTFDANIEANRRSESKNNRKKSTEELPSAIEEETEEVDEEAPRTTNDGYFSEFLALPTTVAGGIWYILVLPIVLLARLTIPDCRFPIFQNAIGYISTFSVSIVWIAVLSHYTLYFATKFGCIVGIPTPLMGLTLVAAGTSVPDALSSILVARAGQGDMAVSNAIGSNVFDILFALGLPFFLSNIVYKEPVEVASDDILLSIGILFGVLFFVVLVLVISRWRLHPIAGTFMVLLYASYVVFAYLRELGVF